MVALVGDLDSATADQLATELDDVGPAAHLVVDVSGLDFIDSTGLNILAVRGRSSSETGGSLVVAGAPEHIARVFDIVGLGESVGVEASVEEAMRRASISSSGG